MESVTDGELKSEREESRCNEPVSSAFIRHIAAHAHYDAALLFTQGQYLLYARRGGQVVRKGVSAESVRAAFVEEAVDSGWLPEGVMRWGSGPEGIFLVKFIPPSKHEIRLAMQDGAEPLIIRPVLPALVFAGVNQTYYVWAMQGNTCDPTAQLFRAPFPNIYPDGHICFGNNRPPVAGWKTLDEAWRLFLTSPFNADMASGSSQASPHDVRRQLMAMAKAKARRYPERDLVPYRSGLRDVMRSKEWRTLNDVVDQLLLKRGNDV